MACHGTDIAIIGGGIMGYATAYALAHANFPGTITVIESDSAYIRGSTGRSVGGIRMQFSTPENIQLSQATRGLIRALTDEFGPGADISFRSQGYLILATKAGQSILQANTTVQHGEGAATQLLDPAELNSRFPWLQTDGLAAGATGATGDEGWCDPASLHALYRKTATALGVQFMTATVTGMTTTIDRITAISLANGDTMGCDIAVNAAGAWAGEIARLIDIDLPVTPRKRYVFAFDCRDTPKHLHAAPLTVPPEGVYFRPEGRIFIGGRSPDPDQEPANLDLDTIDHNFFEQEVWPTLAARIPAFEAIKVVNAWAGYYDFNTFDQNAIIGPHPEVANFFLLNGFSGHGIQHAPAAGRAIAELIMHGDFKTIDLSRLGFARIPQNTPLREHNVI